MNFDEARTLLKRYGFTDEDPINLWLNASIQNLLLEHDWSWRYKIAFLDDQVTDTLDPALAANVSIEAIQSLTAYDSQGWWQKLKYIAPTEYARDHPDEIVAATPIGRPLYYTRLGEIIRITPVDPSLNLSYRLVYVPTAVDTTNLPGNSSLDTYLPPGLHYAVVLGAAFIALSAESEEDRAQAAQSQYGLLVANAWTRDSGGMADEPESVVDVMGYGGVR